MRRRTFRLLMALLLVLVVAAIGLVVWLRRMGPPDAARWLPEGDAILYVNTRALRVAAAVSDFRPAQEDETYQQFVQETGIRLERDLDEIAFAVHAPPRQAEKKDTAGSGEEETSPRFSEIFRGRFDAERLAAYLQKLSQRVERYQEEEVFVIPHQGRTVRAAILGPETVAASNVESAVAIEAMIEHYHASAGPRAGPALVRQHYRELPAGSLAWAVARVALGEQGDGLQPPSPLLRMLGGSVVLGSLRYVGSLEAQMQVLAPSDEQAKAMTEAAQAWLALARSLEVEVETKGNDQDVEALLGSLAVEQEGARVVVSASVPTGFLRKMLAEPPGEAKSE